MMLMDDISIETKANIFDTLVEIKKHGIYTYQYNKYSKKSYLVYICGQDLVIDFDSSELGGKYLCINIVFRNSAEVFGKSRLFSAQNKDWWLFKDKEIAYKFAEENGIIYK